MSGAGPATFSRAGALALVAVGFAVFLALIYLIASGEEFGAGRNDGQAHAAGNGLNGYAGLVQLVEAEGYDVTRSRSPAGLETEGLLVLTPPPATNPEELAKILASREDIGPTLVILPKWDASRPPSNLPEPARAKFKPGWVMLTEAFPLEWTAELPAPYGFKTEIEKLEPDDEPGWEGFGLAGDLPTRTILYAEDNDTHEPLVHDVAGHTLAFRVLGDKGNNYYKGARWPIFIAEPDLANNYGLADKARAAAAMAMVRAAAYDDDISTVTFDMTLNGFGASENLLTLAFRPPFLAATLCLLMALLIVGWRAFQRFGPPASSGPAIAFGKQQLIANGAGLIVRARRLQLLRQPYVTLSARRIAEQLGLARPDPQAIDAALARRLPHAEPFARRAARLEAATRPADILSAAQGLDNLTTNLSQSQTKQRQ